MEAQAAISAARLRTKVGRTLDVLVDSIDGDTASSRSTADAPEIDGTVSITGASNIVAGTFVQVRVTGADAHDLHATLV